MSSANKDTQKPFWGIVDPTGNVVTWAGHVQIFKTRREARKNMYLLNTTAGLTAAVRKLLVRTEARRNEGGT